MTRFFGFRKLLESRPEIVQSRQIRCERLQGGQGATLVLGWKPIANCRDHLLLQRDELADVHPLEHRSKSWNFRGSRGLLQLNEFS